MNLPILLLPVFFISVHAMFMPIRHQYYGGGGDSDEATTSSHASSSDSSPTSGASTTTSTMRLEYVCDAGWKKFDRPPSNFNKNTGVWCFIPSDIAISVNNASVLCEVEGSVLTDFETETERNQILAEAKKHIIDLLKHPSGAVALAGNKIQECTGTNSSILHAPPCNDPTKVYTIPSSSQTNPKFLWENWATGEPSHNFWTYDVEECLQMFVTPSKPDTDGKINDFYCTMNSAPNDGENPRYMNFGALCGKEPAIESF